MNDVEFVTTVEEREPSPPSAGRDKWSRTELELALASASAHIRYLLHELTQGEFIPAKSLKSKPVAYAQTQRVCNSRGKEPLIVTSLRDGEKCYSLQPAYREEIAALVGDALPPPPTEPKPRSERRPRGRRQPLSALDGIADTRGSSFSRTVTPAPVRRIAQTQSGRSLGIPPEISIEFCKELLGFVNATSTGTRYRIILEDDGYRLEAC